MCTSFFVEPNSMSDRSLECLGGEALVQIFGTSRHLAANSTTSSSREAYVAGAADCVPGIWLAWKDISIVTTRNTCALDVASSSKLMASVALVNPSGMLHPAEHTTS